MVMPGVDFTKRFCLNRRMENQPYYRSYNQYLQETFGCRVGKLSIDAGFTCPNRDGTKGKGGCTFCDPTGSSSRNQDMKDSITDQLLKNMPWMRRRYKAKKFLAYFQSYTNTYDSPCRLKAMYDEALGAHSDIAGLAISTRPDCVDEEKIALIASYKAPGRDISIEYGMQTIHNRTLERLNRCETHEDFLKALELTRKYELHHCIHIILGLPGESYEDQMATADEMARLKVDGVKIHCLCAMEHTPLAEEYHRGEWKPLELEEYVSLACDFVERLHPECIIHRISGNGHPQGLVAPEWLKKRVKIMDMIQQEFEHRNTRQGSHYQNASLSKVDHFNQKTAVSA